MMRWLDHFTVVLLDMNGTFMFGHDRLGPSEDYFASYLGLGGGSLDRAQVQHALRATCDALLRDYAFAFHEIGHVPAAHAAFIARLSRTHQLGIVSNLCATPEPWLELFLRRTHHRADARFVRASAERLSRRRSRVVRWR